jgi:hypothetical protein
VPPGMGVGFLNVSIIRLRSLLLAEADPLNTTWYYHKPQDKLRSFLFVRFTLERVLFFLKRMIDGSLGTIENPVFPDLRNYIKTAGIIL